MVGRAEGSLLFWSRLLACYAAVVVFTNRRRHREIMPYTVAILMGVQAFFLLMNAFVVSPFRVLAMDGLVTAVPDGNGLNPQLQYAAMAIHPRCCTWDTSVLLCRLPSRCPPC